MIKVASCSECAVANGRHNLPGSALSDSNWKAQIPQLVGILLAHLAQTFQTGLLFVKHRTMDNGNLESPRKESVPPGELVTVCAEASGHRTESKSWKWTVFHI